MIKKLDAEYLRYFSWHEIIAAKINEIVDAVNQHEQRLDHDNESIKLHYEQLIKLVEKQKGNSVAQIELRDIPELTIDEKIDSYIKVFLYNRNELQLRTHIKGLIKQFNKARTTE